ncbi:hypothetical protein [Natrinema gelatinilyticum]|uniref:hypothetical protein n=1 Tax=Natrinema gelatinilyticum TaxID=2961571 RepID=UPI0020C56FBC|nr:hypothetical protein [Natrinema gelatinilyticum]
MGDDFGLVPESITADFDDYRSHGVRIRWHRFAIKWPVRLSPTLVLVRGSEERSGDGLSYEPEAEPPGPGLEPWPQCRVGPPSRRDDRRSDPRDTDYRATLVQRYWPLAFAHHYWLRASGAGISPYLTCAMPVGGSPR